MTGEVRVARTTRALKFCFARARWSQLEIRLLEHTEHTMEKNRQFKRIRGDGMERIYSRSQLG